MNSIISNIQDEGCINNFHQYYEDISRGEIICSNCGLVLESGLISSELSLPRLKNTQSDNRSGVEFYHIDSPIFLQTQLPKSNETKNSSLSRALKLRLQLGWNDRKLVFGISDIKKICSTLNLPETVRFYAIYLFRKVLKGNQFRSHFILLLTRICTYYSIKFHQIAFELPTLLQETTYSVNLAYRYYYSLVQKLNLPHIQIEPTNYLLVFCSKLHLSETIVQESRKIIDNISLKDGKGLNPKGICAAAIYCACFFNHIKRSQKDVATIAGVSEITLRSRLKDIQKKYVSKLRSNNEYNSYDMSPL